MRPSGNWLGPLDLVEILGSVVVDGGPEQAAQVGKAIACGSGGLCLDRGQFGLGSGRKIGLKAVLDHGGVGGGHKIEVIGMTGMHEGSCS